MIHYIQNQLTMSEESETHILLGRIVFLQCMIYINILNKMHDTTIGIKEVN